MGLPLRAARLLDVSRHRLDGIHPNAIGRVGRVGTQRIERVGAGDLAAAIGADVVAEEDEPATAVVYGVASTVFNICPIFSFLQLR